jgi:transcriptional regulator with GAF, ATPase, and Fis domain
MSHFKEIVGQSRLLKHVLKSTRQVAKLDTTVLILGETGTGKELIARAIHRASLRSQNPFITVNCAAVPEKLFESELFGHEPGAFTSADQRRIGRFELADGGTLFLDEVGELCMEAQAKLLRVIQEGTFERVGGSKTLSVDVRVIAASNRALEQEILNHRFRADLFYRLNVYPIKLPPLRDRKADIPLLVDYFVPRLSAHIRKPIHRTPVSTMNQLMAYAWPGNVRELKNVIERAIITSPSTDLQLPEPLGKPTILLKDGDGAERHGSSQSLAEVERRHITDVLEATGWRISGPKGAAAILDLNPSTLRYRIKKMGIRPSLR